MTETNTVQAEQLFVESGRTLESLDSDTKAKLNALSKELFGATSRWTKMVKTGRFEQVTEEVTEYVPGEKEEDEGTTRKVQVPIKVNGMAISRRKRFTVDEVESYMLKLKAQLDAFKAIIEQQKKAQEAAKAQAELDQKVQETVSGSAV